MPGKHADMVTRFWAKVDTTGDCWTWTAATNRKGYGLLQKPNNSGQISAHRYSAMLHFGMFDRGLMVLHHCDNPPCVNPSHLYLGDGFDNARDKIARGRSHHQRKTHCPSGHPYDEANTYLWRGRHRQCRECARLREARKRAEVTA